MHTINYDIFSKTKLLHFAAVCAWKQSNNDVHSKIYVANLHLSVYMCISELSVTGSRNSVSTKLWHFVAAVCMHVLLQAV